MSDPFDKQLKDILYTIIERVVYEQVDPKTATRYIFNLLEEDFVNYDKSNKPVPDKDADKCIPRNEIDALLILLAKKLITRNQKEGPLLDDKLLKATGEEMLLVKKEFEPHLTRTRASHSVPPYLSKEEAAKEYGSYEKYVEKLAFSVCRMPDLEKFRSDYEDKRVAYFGLQEEEEERERVQEEEAKAWKPIQECTERYYEEEDEDNKKKILEDLEKAKAKYQQEKETLDSKDDDEFDIVIKDDKKDETIIEGVCVYGYVSPIQRAIIPKYAESLGQSAIIDKFQSDSNRWKVPIILDGFNVGYDGRMAKEVKKEGELKLVPLNWVRLNAAVEYFEEIGCKNIRIVLPLMEHIGEDIIHYRQGRLWFRARLLFHKVLIDDLPAIDDGRERVPQASFDIHCDKLYGNENTRLKIRKDLQAKNVIYYVPKFVDDDYFVLELARQNNGICISNDQFKNLKDDKEFSDTLSDSNFFRFRWVGNYRNTFCLYHKQKQ